MKWFDRPKSATFCFWLPFLLAIASDINSLVINILGGLVGIEIGFSGYLLVALQYYITPTILLPLSAIFLILRKGRNSSIPVHKKLENFGFGVILLWFLIYPQNIMGCSCDGHMVGLGWINSTWPLTNYSGSYSPEG